ncbi:MAG: efflux RND transporter periplasmic adaptor subunit [Acidobacteriota bacterium]
MKDQKISTALIASIVLSALLAAGCGRSANSANVNVKVEPQLVDVTTEKAVIKPIPSYLEATGNLASDASTDVAPTVAGKIVEVNFDIGSYVNKGDVLVRLDARDAAIKLDQARSQVEQQRQAVVQAEANVQQAIANLAQTQARLGVPAGQSFSVDAFPAVRSIAAQLTLAETELRRTERLLESGDVSKSAFDQRKAQRDQLAGQLADARASAQVASKAVGTAQAAVDAARAVVANTRAGITTAQTQVAAAQKAVADTAVYAPLSGYVSDKVADVGEYISPSAPNTKIATIVRTSTLRMKIDIPEASIGKVGTGQGISLQTSAYPDRSFAGTIVRIAPSLNPTARTLTVEAEVQNTEGLLKPGQFATVRVTQNKPEPAVLIPVSAVKTVGDINSVFVVKDGAAREQIVQLGLLENGMIQVKSGVVEGDLVVTSNPAALTDGVFVRQ